MVVYKKVRSLDDTITGSAYIPVCNKIGLHFLHSCESWKENPQEDGQS